MASFFGQVSVIEYLVRNQSINVNLKANANEAFPEITNRARGITPLHYAVRGCSGRRNPNFKETANMLRALGADPTVKNDYQRTAKQDAQSRLFRAIKDPNSPDYDYFSEKFESCEECLAKKKEEGLTYWDEMEEEIFNECLNECSNAPCYPNF
jgi:hypothetical protein